VAKLGLGRNSSTQPGSPRPSLTPLRTPIFGPPVNLGGLSNPISRPLADQGPAVANDTSPPLTEIPPAPIVNPEPHAVPNPSITGHLIPVDVPPSQFPGQSNQHRPETDDLALAATYLRHAPPALAQKYEPMIASYIEAHEPPDATDASGHPPNYLGPPVHVSDGQPVPVNDQGIEQLIREQHSGGQLAAIPSITDSPSGPPTDNGFVIGGHITNPGIDQGANDNEPLGFQPGWHPSDPFPPTHQPAPTGPPTDNGFVIGGHITNPGIGAGTTTTGQSGAPTDLSSTGPTHPPFPPHGPLPPPTHPPFPAHGPLGPPQLSFSPPTTPITESLPTQLPHGLIPVDQPPPHPGGTPGPVTSPDNTAHNPLDNLGLRDILSAEANSPKTPKTGLSIDGITLPGGPGKETNPLGGFDPGASTGRPGNPGFKG